MASSYRATRSALFFTRFRSIGAWSSPGSLVNRFACKNISQLVKPNGKHAFLVDTSALIRRLESQGIPSKQTEAITPAITGVLNDSLKNFSHTFVSKEEMQKIVMAQDANISKFNMVQDANLSKFKFEMQSFQEYHFSMLQRENEKLRAEIDKIRSELRYEMDEIVAGQRRDLNLERGRIRDEFANKDAEMTNLSSKLDREIDALREHVAAANYDMIRFCVPLSLYPLLSLLFSAS